MTKFFLGDSKFFIFPLCAEAIYYLTYQNSHFYRLKNDKFVKLKASHISAIPLAPRTFFLATIRNVFYFANSVTPFTRFLSARFIYMQRSFFFHEFFLLFLMMAFLLDNKVISRNNLENFFLSYFFLHIYSICFFERDALISQNFTEF